MGTIPFKVETLTPPTRIECASPTAPRVRRHEDVRLEPQGGGDIAHITGLRSLQSVLPRDAKFFLATRRSEHVLTLNLQRRVGGEERKRRSNAHPLS
jgi:hypothetical protein